MVTFCVTVNTEKIMVVVRNVITVTMVNFINFVEVT